MYNSLCKQYLKYFAEQAGLTGGTCLECLEGHASHVGNVRTAKHAIYLSQISLANNNSFVEVKFI